MRVFRMLILALIGLLIGYVVGGYFTFQRATLLIRTTPASPIVVGAFYDREDHALVYLVSNPGAVPLKIVGHSLIFTPGEESQEPAYRLVDIPSDVDLPPFQVVEVVLDLKAGSQELLPGDVLAVTLNYTHPFSADLYAVAHTTVITEDLLQGTQPEAIPTTTPQATATP
ncbi:MAG: hypothetical protein GXO36_05155 [Chloroflexi bacterium]|nr:hypothetical protein [Chloroflexota bacterium]